MCVSAVSWITESKRLWWRSSLVGLVLGVYECAVLKILVQLADQELQCFLLLDVDDALPLVFVDVGEGTCEKPSFGVFSPLRACARPQVSRSFFERNANATLNASRLGLAIWSIRGDLRGIVKIGQKGQIHFILQ